MFIMCFFQCLSDIMSDVMRENVGHSGQNVGHSGQNVGHVRMSDDCVCVCVCVCVLNVLFKIHLKVINIISKYKQFDCLLFFS